ncbi:MAG: SOS response-associated peptidase [Chloroflexi bacterium]|nr:SOS response-associated peptidase [Chloroflexota bacterium]
MCGRYTLVNLTALPRRFRLDALPPALPQRFNIAPSEQAPVVLRQSPNRLALMPWGVLPRWAMEEKAGGRRLINARAETVAQAKTFAFSLRRRRLIVPASGWYEWQSTTRGRQPYYFRRRDGDLLGFAGLAVSGADGEGYVIITVPANELAARIHPRMPAVLDPAEEDHWLDPTCRETSALLALLRPCPPETLSCYPVSRRVNHPGIDDPHLIEPIGEALA